MDVLAAAEGLDEGRVLRKVGQDPQLDLAVVRGQETETRLGHEGLPDPSSLSSSDGDVLEIRVRGREPPCGRHRLVLLGVNPARLWPHESGEECRRRWT